jgi:MCM N-terminal domain
MAGLFALQNPVDYKRSQGMSIHRLAHLTVTAAFEDFLKNYKSTAAEAADAIARLNLEDEDLDNEYDFMDESGDETGARRVDPKFKYLRQLQQVADRQSTQIVIDLDDLAAVSLNSVKTFLIV